MKNCDCLKCNKFEECCIKEKAEEFSNVVKKLLNKDGCQGFVEAMSDLRRVATILKSFKYTEEDSKIIGDDFCKLVKDDLQKRGSKPRSKKMLARISAMRRHYNIGRCHVFYNIFVKKKTAVLKQFLKTVTVPTNKGQLHVLSGENFSIFAVSHFFDRLIERHKIDLNRPQAMDYLYTKLFGSAIFISPWNDMDIVKLNEGMAIGKVLPSPDSASFFLITYISEELITNEQRQLFESGLLFRTTLLEMTLTPSTTEKTSSPPKDSWYMKKEMLEEILKTHYSKSL